jgi:predicted enzyme related to lactoylglutathione lyase
MKRVVGIGGVFFKCEDPKALGAWYERHLGIAPAPDGSGVNFGWRHEDAPERKGMTVWAPFSKDTKYFGTGPSSLMLNYLVEDIDAVVAALKAEGVNVDEKREDHPYGRFAWGTDPEGNRFELWQPAPEE